MNPNTLYYGDNLDILRRYVKDASVDMIYLDPPFNSQRDYNVFFKESSGDRSEAQLKAFRDTWPWDDDAIAAYRALVEQPQFKKVSKTMQGFKLVAGEGKTLAYLAMMAPRLMELKRVLSHQR